MFQKLFLVLNDTARGLAGSNPMPGALADII